MILNDYLIIKLAYNQSTIVDYRLPFIERDNAAAFAQFIIDQIVVPTTTTTADEDENDANCDDDILKSLMTDIRNEEIANKRILLLTDIVFDCLPKYYVSFMALFDAKIVNILERKF